MTKDEALKMAIEVLDLNVDCVSESKWKEAINACKEALEQPTLKDEKGRPMTYWGGLEQPEEKEFFERGKEIARWADKQALKDKNSV
jgi:hypothetical protein